LTHQHTERSTEFGGNHRSQTEAKKRIQPNSIMALIYSTMALKVIEENLVALD